MRRTATTAIIALAFGAAACRENTEQVVQPPARQDARCVIGLLAIEGTHLRSGVPTVVHDIRQGARRVLGNAPYNQTIPPVGDNWDGDAPGETVWRVYFQTRGRSLVSLCPDVQALMTRTQSSYASNLVDPERSGSRLEIGAPVVLGDEALVDVGDFVLGSGGSSRLEYYRRTGDDWTRVGTLVLRIAD